MDAKKPDQSKRKMHKEPPRIKQTLTSYKRMLLANPLLELEKSGMNITEYLKSLKVESQQQIQNIKTKAPITSNKPQVLTVSSAKPVAPKLPKAAGKPNTLPAPKPKKLDRKTNILPIPKTGGMRAPEPKNSTRQVESKPRTLTTLKMKPKQPEPKKSETKAELIVPVTSRKNEVPNGALASEENHVRLNRELNKISPIPNTNKMNEYIFKTPSAYSRRSGIRDLTPYSSRTLFRASTPAVPTLQKLEDRLNQWLRSRGKPPASFHHLRVFGSNKAASKALPTTDEENKENIEQLTERSDSYESLRIEQVKENPCNNNNNSEDEIASIPERDLHAYSKGAMNDLLALIEEGYPREQCLEWLELVKTRYNKIVNEPEYWECKAALEQAAGNVKDAVEFYKTAIIQGAEVNKIDKSLDQLYKKFSLLSIDPNIDSYCAQRRREKERVDQEANHVFRSNIIQFAMRERTKNKIGGDKTVTPAKEVVITPVRRSTRISRSHFTVTPGMTICDSLKNVDLSQPGISFERNRALI